MTAFIIQYHVYEDDRKVYKSSRVSFKWYEYISTDRVIKRFFKRLDSDYPVHYSDIDEIYLDY